MGVQIDENIFLGADKLKILDLGNAETNVTSGTLAPLTDLQFLFLQLNNIGKITTSFFQNNENLEYVDATNAMIAEIAVDAFSNNKRLAQMLLRQNHLQIIEGDTFSPLISLSWLDLGRNSLKNINSNLFKSNTNLRIIDLDSNKLVSVCKRAFDSQRDSLIAINLSDNPALPQPLNQNFCNEDYCDFSMEVFWTTLDQNGVECD